MGLSLAGIAAFLSLAPLTASSAILAAALKTGMTIATEQLSEDRFMEIPGLTKIPY